MCLLWDTFQWIYQVLRRHFNCKKFYFLYGFVKRFSSRKKQKLYVLVEISSKLSSSEEKGVKVSSDFITNEIQGLQILCCVGRRGHWQHSSQNNVDYLHGTKRRRRRQRAWTGKNVVRSFPTRQENLASARNTTLCVSCLGLALFIAPGHGNERRDSAY